MPDDLLSAIDTYERRAPSGPYTLLSTHPETPEDYLHRWLNERLEHRLSQLLRQDERFAPTVTMWARQMATTIPGYNSWSEVSSYVQRSLESDLECPDQPETLPVGTECDLVGLLDTEQRSLFGPPTAADTVPVTQEEEAELLSSTRRKLAALDQFRISNSTRLDFPRRLFRKIYYCHKLREVLLGQVGYYNGSLELRAGLAHDFEYWMYLIQLKLRRPDRQHLYKAPKAFRLYRTPPGSPLPWNNQFSFSYGFDEFEPGQLPRRVIRRMELHLAAALRDRSSWKKLCSLLGRDGNDPELEAARAVAARKATGPSQPVHGEGSPADVEELILERLITALADDEVALKALFTLVLKLTWSDEPLEPRHNPFAIVENGSDAGPLHTTSLKDPRLPQASSPEEALASANLRYNVVGVKANALLEPASAAETFRAKLGALSPEDFADLYSNVPQEQRTVEAIVDQAVQAASTWAEQARAHNRPIMTGPSGHVVSYLNIYLEARAQLENSQMAKAPTAFEARIVLLAGMIGINHHHTYDEVMHASVGITDGSNTLDYTDRRGFADLEAIAGEWGQKLRKTLAAEADTIALAATQECQKSSGNLARVVSHWRAGLGI